jgi:hypothetical protein
MHIVADIIADRNGGLLERREDEGVITQWDPAIHNANDIFNDSHRSELN